MNDIFLLKLDADKNPSVMSLKAVEMLPYLISSLVVAITTLIVAWYLWYFKFYRYLKSVPRMRQVPLLGGALELSSTTVMYKRLLELQKELGNNFWTLLGTEPVLITSDPGLLKVILTSNKLLQKSQTYAYLYNWLGLGLLTSSGEKWRSSRKIITPAFHFKILEEQSDTFNKASDILVKKLANEVGSADMNIEPYVTLASLDIICEAAMGTSVKAQLDSDNNYVRSVKAMGKIVTERLLRPVEKFSATYFFTQNYWTERRCLKILHGFTNSVIKQRREAVSLLDIPKTNEFGMKKRLAFLDLLLSYTLEGANLSDRNIREEVDTFMFEGHDTSSSGVTFTLFLLANHPAEQEKVFAEIRSIFDDDQNRFTTFKDLQEMKYLEMVIKESMRLFPPVPLIARELTEDLEYGGFVMPKGLTVLLAIYLLHRDPAIYPEPEAFRPERFLPQAEASRNAFDYIPFSAGPRNCIGQKFAMNAMKSTISKVIRNFELLPVKHDLQLSLEATLKTKNGARIKLKARKW